MCSLGCYESDLQVVMVRISDLHEFKDSPFQVRKNKELLLLRDSIRNEGILTPLTIRKNPSGEGYEIIAGHRRKLAAELNGLEFVPAVVKVLNDDQAIIELVDSNLHREKILPSEKAFAYKKKLESMKHQGRRNDLTFSRGEEKLDIDETTSRIYKVNLEIDREKNHVSSEITKKGIYANELLAKQVGESRAQISRYIRLTALIPKLLKMVDENQLAL